MKLQKTARGVRLVHAGHVISEVLSAPGPTHSVFDVLAACLFLGNPKRCAILGFAGGGLLAPLCELGMRQPVDAVDLSDEGFSVYEKYVQPWSMPVRFHHADAASWLRHQKAPYDAILEDLSIQGEGDVLKPEVSFKTLPSLMARHLRSSGVAVFNMFPAEGFSEKAVSRMISSPFALTHVVEMAGYQNKALVAGRHLPSARAFSRDLRAALTWMGSHLAKKVKIHALRPA
jgi:hypothetical protein